ncbi:MAG: AbgT family transporter [Prolixibacteraceae bacterium]|nr:AbgT family transporter [Prolixibacteraceae bacterium]
MTKKVPHTFVIVFSIIVFAAILTWIIPPGKFVKETQIIDGKEQTLMVYHKMGELPDGHPSKTVAEAQTWQIFSALFNGFVKQAGIIVFILVIGGAFWIMNQTKAIDVAIFSFLKRIRKLDKTRFLRYVGIDNVVVVFIMLLFSAFGAIFGMSEETIAFAIIFVPLAVSMGYDSITGVCMVYIAAHIGFAGAILNPFTIGIAQGLAGIPLFSGIEYRLFCWVAINVAGIGFVLWYMAKIRRNPKLSPVYEEDAHWREHVLQNAETTTYYTPKMAWVVYGLITTVLVAFAVKYPESILKIGNSSVSLPIIPISAALFALIGWFSLKKSIHFFILLILGYTILFLIVGVMGYDWYVMEIATLFLAAGIASGMAFNQSANEIAQSFIDGMKDIYSAALIVGLAGGIIVVLEDGGVIDSILYGLSKSLGQFGKIASVEIMYGIQTLINIIIPSGSAKAAITMPLMAPFGDLIGISRQATVMAFQFGDGFTNMITPTSGVLIGVLGVARIPYQKWVKWVFPLIAILFLLGALLLIPTVTMQLNGF